MNKSFKRIAFNLAILTGSVMAVHSAFAEDKNVLTDNQDMTLYIFDNDNKGESVCYDACEANWLPYIASKYAKGKRGFKVITRRDGTQQWAYKNKPLYTWTGDLAKGDMTGDGVGGVWRAAKEKTQYQSYGRRY